MEEANIATPLSDDDRVELARCRVRPGDSRARRWMLASFALHSFLAAAFFLQPPAGTLTLEDYDRDAIDYVFCHVPPEVSRFEIESPSAAPGVEPGAVEPGSASGVTSADRPRPGVRASDSRSPEDRARASLDVLRAALATERGPVSPFTDRGDDAGDVSLLVGAGSGLDMNGTGRGTGRDPNDTIALGESFGMGAQGATCEDARVLPNGVVVTAGCTGFGANGTVQGHAGSMRQAVRESRTPRICGGGPVGCDPHVSGALTREQVRRVVARQRAQVRHCYEQGLASRPDLAGRVTVSWVVSPDGHVTVSNIDAGGTDLRSAQVEQCVVTAVRRWTFPQSGGVTAVRYPFVLDTME